MNLGNKVRVNPQGRMQVRIGTNPKGKWRTVYMSDGRPIQVRQGSAAWKATMKAVKAKTKKK